MTAAHTRRLASAHWEVVADARPRALLRAALVAVLVMVGLAAGLKMVADAAGAAGERSRLVQENAGLRTELARREAELQIERATRAALDQQVADLNDEVAELERQLAFVNAQRGRTRGGSTTN